MTAHDRDSLSLNDSIERRIYGPEDDVISQCTFCFGNKVSADGGILTAEDAGPAHFGLVTLPPPNPVPTVPVVPKNCCQAFIFNY